VRGTLGFNGAGMCIGVLSDSFNSLGAAGADVTSGNLPGAGTPFPFSQPVGFAGSGDGSGGDEGRAMLQIVHDLAPGARLYFATAFGGINDFANNILALRGISPNPGAFGNVFPKCDIIIDDVFYFVETGLHDGQLAPSTLQHRAAHTGREHGRCRRWHVLLFRRQFRQYDAGQAFDG
jgi:hypothetical protein